uniref:Uncharacterized protein n=1 Tax=Utricularia reniformis TaxID=192314 RepID=A0A1Y0B287_9LAMI|nr:hypothetical protein AEK19_MT1298 [Utricularia reniformis]ART31501.1 hypothetical protein AEK19_MT1298 [Utricularia reniformis]
MSQLCRAALLVLVQRHHQAIALNIRGPLHPVPNRVHYKAPGEKELH